MTEDQMRALVKECGAWVPNSLPSDWDKGDIVFTPDQLVMFALQVESAERERCAKVAEQQAACNGLAAGWHIAAEIRAA